jgi:hypothetical protein
LLDNLQTTNGGFNPSADHEAVIGIVPIASNVTDAGVAAVTNPTGFYCGNSVTFTPSLKLQNYGRDVLTSCVINYQIDNGTVQTQNWAGSLVFGQSTTINLPSSLYNAGTHTLTCFSSAPNSSVDQNAANDQSVTYFTITSSANLPIIESFENNILPSAMWNVSHTSSNGIDFSIANNAAATGSKSAMIDNMNNVAGNNSILQTYATYDLSTFASPALSFKVAYQSKASSNNDKLQVYTSTDCGASWQSRWARWSPTLSVLGGVGTSAYVPAATDFTTYTVNIANVATSTSVIFRWEFYADPHGPGNNLYLDDINIVDASQASGIESIENLVNLNLYPNPSTGLVNLAFNFTESHQIGVQVNDMLGRVIETIDAKTYQAGETTIALGAKNKYQTGVYFVNITVDGQKISKKVIVE